MFERKNTFEIDRLYTRQSPIIPVKVCDRKEQLWVVPMLLGQGILIALIFYQINTSFLY